MSDQDPSEATSGGAVEFGPKQKKKTKKKAKKAKPRKRAKTKRKKTKRKTRRKPKKKPKDPLNVRQKTFVDVYVGTGNASQAAREAGYSVATAHVQGHRLLSQDKIQDAIETRRLSLIANTLSPEAVSNRLWLEAKGLGPDTSPTARVNALGLLSKLLGMVTEKREVTSTVTAKVEVDEAGLEALLADADVLEQLDVIAKRQEQISSQSSTGGNGGNGGRGFYRG